MIKFRASTDDGFILGFGLSEENVKRLKQGKPILIDLDEMGIHGGKLTIFYGKTEAKMARELSEMIGPDTEIHGL